MSDRIRTTISLDPEIHALFVSMAEVSGTSVSRCMGDWLSDTAEGAQFVTLKMKEAREAPRIVIREAQAMARGLLEEVNATARQVREGARGKAEPAPRAAPHLRPPSSNTGGKVPRKNPKSTGGEV